MDKTIGIPASLKIVAFLFLLSGVFSLIEVIVALMQSQLNLNIGVVSLFIGPGLLRLSRGWRTFALVSLWVAMIGMPIIAIHFMTAGSLDFKLFGQMVGHAPKELGIMLVGAVFSLAVWQYRVLTRPEVCSLFRVPGA